MANVKDEIRINVNARSDGRYSVDIKLVGWDVRDLQGLAANLSLSVFARRIAPQLANAVEEVRKERSS